MEQSEGGKPDVIPLCKEEGNPVDSNHLHPIWPACIHCISVLSPKTCTKTYNELISDELRPWARHDAYSFAKSACSFLGSICSMAPLSSRMGYEVHIFAAEALPPISLCCFCTYMCIDLSGRRETRKPSRWRGKWRTPDTPLY